MIDIAKIEGSAEKLARRTRNNIPSGWWKCLGRDKVNALVATGRWEFARVTGTVQFPNTRAVQITETFLRRVK